MGLIMWLIVGGIIGWLASLIICEHPPFICAPFFARQSHRRGGFRLTHACSRPVRWKRCWSRICPAMPRACRPGGA